MEGRKVAIKNSKARKVAINSKERKVAIRKIERIGKLQ